jgi:hypothetical protein
VWCNNNTYYEHLTISLVGGKIIVMKKIFWIIISVVGVIIALPIILIIIVILINPNFMGLDYSTKMKHNFIPKIQNEYGLTFNENDEVIHFSEYTVADDSGYDLIIYNKNLDMNNYISENGKIEYNYPRDVNLFNVYDLCKDEPMEIQDEKVRGLICNLEDSKIKIPMSSLDGVNLVVKNDMPMEINVAIFLPEDNLVWIKYFRW